MGKKKKNSAGKATAPSHGSEMVNFMEDSSFDPPRELEVKPTTAELDTTAQGAAIARVGEDTAFSPPMMTSTTSQHQDASNSEDVELLSFDMSEPENFTGAASSKPFLNELSDLDFSGHLSLPAPHAQSTESEPSSQPFPSDWDEPRNDRVQAREDKHSMTMDSNLTFSDDSPVGISERFVQSTSTQPANIEVVPYSFPADVPVPSSFGSGEIGLTFSNSDEAISSSDTDTRLPSRTENEIMESKSFPFLETVEVMENPRLRVLKKEQGVSNTDFEDIDDTTGVVPDVSNALNNAVRTGDKETAGNEESIPTIASGAADFLKLTGIKSVDPPAPNVYEQQHHPPQIGIDEPLRIPTVQSVSMDNLLVMPEAKVLNTKSEHGEGNENDSANEQSHEVDLDESMSTPLVHGTTMKNQSDDDTEADPQVSISGNEVPDMHMPAAKNFETLADVNVGHHEPPPKTHVVMSETLFEDSQMITSAIEFADEASKSKIRLEDEGIDDPWRTLSCSLTDSVREGTPVLDLQRGDIAGGLSLVVDSQVEPSHSPSTNSDQKLFNGQPQGLGDNLRKESLELAIPDVPFTNARPFATYITPEDDIDREDKAPMVPTVSIVPSPRTVRFSDLVSTVRLPTDRDSSPAFGASSGDDPDDPLSLSPSINIEENGRPREDSFQDVSFSPESSRRDQKHLDSRRQSAKLMGEIKSILKPKRASSKRPNTEEEQGLTSPSIEDADMDDLEAQEINTPRPLHVETQAASFVLRVCCGRRPILVCIVLFFVSLLIAQGVGKSSKSSLSTVTSEDRDNPLKKAADEIVGHVQERLKSFKAKPIIISTVGSNGEGLKAVQAILSTMGVQIQEKVAFSGLMLQVNNEQIKVGFKRVMDAALTPESGLSYDERSVAASSALSEWHLGRAFVASLLNATVQSIPVESSGNRWGVAHSRAGYLLPYFRSVLGSENFVFLQVVKNGFTVVSGLYEEFRHMCELLRFSSYCTNTPANKLGFWAKANKDAFGWAKHMLDVDHYIVIRAEDLQRGNLGCIAQVAKVLGLSIDDEILQKAAAAGQKVLEQVEGVDDNSSSEKVQEALENLPDVERTLEFWGYDAEDAAKLTDCHKMKDWF